MVLGILNIIIGAFIFSPNLVSKDIRSKYRHELRWLGIIILVWGGLSVVSCILNFYVIASDPLSWLLWLVGGAAGVALGAIVGHSVLTKYVKNKWMEDTLDKLLPHHRQIAMAAIAIGIVQVFL